MAEMEQVLDRLERVEAQSVTTQVVNATLITEIKSLTTQINKLENSVEVLNENMNKGRGAIAVLLVAGAALSAAISLLIAYFRN